MFHSPGSYPSTAEVISAEKGTLRPGIARRTGSGITVHTCIASWLLESIFENVRIPSAFQNHCWYASVSDREHIYSCACGMAWHITESEKDESLEVNYCAKVRILPGLNFCFFPCSFGAKSNINCCHVEGKKEVTPKYSAAVKRSDRRNAEFPLL